MVRFLFLSALLFLFLPLGASATKHTDTRQGVRDLAFSSLQIYAGDDQQADAVVLLGEGNHSLTVEFDEFSSEVRYMRYNLLHCDARWQPSQLVESEYIEGFNEGTIDDYEFSRATTVQYIHYRLSLPNDKIRFTISGNYLLRIYDESDPDNTWLQARFRVTEQEVGVSADATSHTDVDYNDRHQQLTVNIDAPNTRLHDAFNDFTLVIRQNGRTDDVRYISHPLRVQGTRLVYEHMPELIFPGGNEYRRFETISTHSTSMRIAEVAYHGPYYHAWVETDVPRFNQQYIYDKTQHGKYKVREYNSTRPETEADYLMTHFTLAMDRLHNADIYIEGDLTDRTLNRRSAMTYNDEAQCYEATLLLKQGSYNYQYIARQRDSGKCSTAPVEGDFYNTANEYEIEVFQHRPGERYDRLIGYYRLQL